MLVAIDDTASLVIHLIIRDQSTGLLAILHLICFHILGFLMNRIIFEIVS